MLAHYSEIIFPWTKSNREDEMRWENSTLTVVIDGSPRNAKLVKVHQDGKLLEVVWKDTPDSIPIPDIIDTTTAQVFLNSFYLDGELVDHIVPHHEYGDLHKFTDLEVIQTGQGLFKVIGHTLPEHKAMMSDQITLSRLQFKEEYARTICEYLTSQMVNADQIDSFTLSLADGKKQEMCVIRERHSGLVFTLDASYVEQDVDVIRSPYNNGPIYLSDQNIHDLVGNPGLIDVPLRLNTTAEEKLLNEHLTQQLNTAFDLSKFDSEKRSIQVTYSADISATASCFINIPKDFGKSQIMAFLRQDKDEMDPAFFEKGETLYHLNFTAQFVDENGHEIAGQETVEDD